MLKPEEIRKAYNSGEFCGWAEVRYPGIAKYEFNLLTKNGMILPRFRLTNPSRSYKGSRMMLYDVVRKVLGKDTNNYPQQIGDCVSFGAKNATEYLQCSEILMKGERERWTAVFPPYYYGTGRVYVGGGRLGNEDGSLGSWMAEAVQKYGTLFSEADNVPTYSGRVAKAWGDPNPRSDLDIFKPIASEYLVKGAALVRTWGDLVTAICNGYPCTVASNIGYDMEPSSDGFHRQRGSWGHQMCATPNMITSYVVPKFIKDSKIGDLVCDMYGNFSEVCDVYERNYDGTIAKIHIRGNLPLELTLNHPVLVERATSNMEEKVTKTGLVLAKIKMETVWVKAGEIQKGDIIISPKPKLLEQKLPSWEKNKKCKNKPKKINYSKDLAWLFGLYIADGNSEPNHKIRITLHKDNEKTIDKCVQAFLKMGLTANIKPVKNKQAVRVTVYSAIVANSFAKWFGKQKNKNIPTWLMNPKWDLLSLLQGIFDGDGNYVDNGCKQSITKRIVNTSRCLVEQIKMILLYLGQNPSISHRRHLQDYAKNWNDIFVIEWVENSTKKKFNYWSPNKDYYCQPVHKVEYVSYKGKVYNLEITGSHSYVLEGVTVHNCFIGVDDEHRDPHAIILNSWGDAHGRLQEFNGNGELPVGCLRVRRADAEKHLRARETFAFSNFQGFPEQQLDKALFDLVGN